MYNKNLGTIAEAVIEIEKLLIGIGEDEMLKSLDFENSEIFSLNRDEYVSHFEYMVPTRDKGKQYVFNGFQTMLGRIHIAKSFSVKTKY
jgi:hypothetical protein